MPRHQKLPRAEGAFQSKAGKETNPCLEMCFLSLLQWALNPQIRALWLEGAVSFHRNVFYPHNKNLIVSFLPGVWVTPRHIIINSTTVELYWNPPERPNGLISQYQLRRNGSLLLVGGRDNQSFTDSNLEPGSRWVRETSPAILLVSFLSCLRLKRSSSHSNVPQLLSCAITDNSAKLLLVLSLYDNLFT